MTSVRTFRDLIAWQKAMELVKAIYSMTASLPDTEKFGLVSQMRRAAVSIPSNIAEGHGRESRADYLRFLKVARGSLMELQTQIILIEELNLAPVEPRIWERQAETDRVLQALIRSLQKINNESR